MCVWSDFVSKSRLWEQKAIKTLWKNSLHVVFLARPNCHRFSLSVFTLFSVSRPLVVIDVRFWKSATESQQLIEGDEKKSKTIASSPMGRFNRFGLRLFKSRRQADLPRKTLNARVLQNYKLFVQSCNFVLDFVRVSTNAFLIDSFWREGVSLLSGGDKRNNNNK